MNGQDIKVIDGVKYKIVPEEFSGSCTGCHIGDFDYCKLRDEYNGHDELECSRLDSIYKRIVQLGIKKKLIL